MLTYKCPYCTCNFSASDKVWDSAVTSGRCPKCREPLRNFPFFTKSPTLQVEGQVTQQVLGKTWKRISTEDTTRHPLYGVGGWRELFQAPAQFCCLGNLPSKVKTRSGYVRAQCESGANSR